MRSIMVLNAKGGCGKSTLATNLASYYAWEEEKAVALMDFDPQASSLEWLAARGEEWPEITGLAAFEGETRVPRNADVVIIDAPARVTGSELSALVRRAETIIVPVLPSPMDMRAAQHFMKELFVVGKVSRKQTKVGVVANRVRENTRIYHELEDYLGKLKIPFLTHLRDTQNYIRAAQRGLGIFELAPSMVWQDLEQWEPLTRWLRSKRSRAM